MAIGFDRPGYLWLLIALPIIAWYGWTTMGMLSPVRRMVAIALRSMVWTAIVLALMGVQWVRTDDRVTVMYLLDQSDSIPPAQRSAMLDFVIDNVRRHRDGVRRDRAGIVVFGRDAAIEIPPYEGEIPALRRLESLSTIDGDNPGDSTNLAAALNLAGASMPEDTARRIVIVTDGNENLGSAAPGAARLAAAGVGIDVVPIRIDAGDEVLVEKIDLPSDIRRGQPFEARVVINRITGQTEPGPVRGRLRVKQDAGGRETLLLEESVELRPGKNVFPLRHQIDAPAAYTYDAEFVADDQADDALPQNNRASAYTYVRGKGRVLMMTQPGAQSQFAAVAAALGENDIEVVTQPSDQMFESLAQLQSFDAILLADLPRVTDAGGDQLISMSDDQIEMLVRNTQQLGAGLLMIGGQNSFGAGGWTGTKLEEAMPVDFRIQNDKVTAVGALALIMHASEMAEGNYWQKVIAKAAIEQLGPQDYAGVLHWTIAGDAWMWGGRNGLQPVGRYRKAMLEALGRMTPGDMPEFDPAMKKAVAGLSRLGNRVSVRHCIIVSDGDPTAPTAATINAFKQNKITISTVAVASHGLTESARLQQIASATGGKYYKAASGRALPKIFQREARRVSKPLVRDIPGGATPQIVFPHPALDGLGTALPPITGLVLTQIKDSPLVQVLIRSPEPPAEENSTVLAVWNYGLGRTAVVTTDAGSRWANAWNDWDGFDKFYSQLTRWLMRPTGDTGKFSIATTSRDGRVTVLVTALSDDDDFLNFLEMGASVIGPDMRPIDLAMEQSAPGRYVGQFEADRSGNYFVSVTPSAGGVPLRTGVTVPYGDEYRARETNAALMQRLVSLSGGRGQMTSPLGTVESPPIDLDPFRDGLSPARGIRDVWHLVVLAACGLFFFDVLTRRVSLRLDPLWRWWAARRGRSIAPEPIRRLDTLRAAKSRATRPRSNVELDLPADGPAIGGGDAPVQTGAEPESETANQPSYTERLLEAKRRAGRDRN